MPKQAPANIKEPTREAANELLSNANKPASLHAQRISKMLDESIGRIAERG